VLSRWFALERRCLSNALSVLQDVKGAAAAARVHLCHVRLKFTVVINVGPGRDRDKLRVLPETEATAAATAAEQRRLGRGWRGALSLII
jgi:hypothetical protein